MSISENSQQKKQDFKKTENAKRIIYVLEILTGTLHLV